MESEQGNGEECGGGVMVEIIVTENGNVRGVFTRVISASLTDSLNGECTFQFSVISSMASEIYTGLAEKRHAELPFQCCEGVEISVLRHCDLHCGVRTQVLRT